MSLKKSHRMEEPMDDYNHQKFGNVGASEKFTLISNYRSFIKEKGFHHPEVLFRKAIEKKMGKALCQPSRLTATMFVREFYANLSSHVVKQVRVRSVLVDFNSRSINEFYNLESVSDEVYDRLLEEPNYTKVLRMLTNG